LIPPQYVKAYVRGNKNDYNDARAIAEAVRRPDIRFVEVKTVEQQDVQALHRLREARVGERTALCNQVRGLLGEYGIVLPKGVSAVQNACPSCLRMPRTV
jgi:transposase